ncbi:hypothetical protein ACS0TY_035861 [Phlomoides rotata]
MERIVLKARVFDLLEGTIGNLSNLHSLDLGFAGGVQDLVVDSLEWLSGLSQLKYLNMNFVNLSRANNWAQMMSTLLPLLTTSISLITLYLLLPPDGLFKFTNLLSLDLSSNSFDGPIPTIINATKLHHIDLSSNFFNSSIPDWFYLCKDLEYVDLSNNNHLSGTISNHFGEFKSLRVLDLGTNSFSGAIPFSIGKLSSLEVLRLNDSKFTGTPPESLGQLFNLQILFIHDNLLEGFVTETHFANLTKLEYLLASGNHLTLKVSPSWNPPFQLSYLQIASWNLGEGSHILSWLAKQKNIYDLDLSNTGISGSIPSWVWKIPILQLSDNHLYGKIQIADTMMELDLSNNSFSGGISHFLCDTTYQNYGLESINLGGNQLSGELPDCWTKWPSLTNLNLGNNHISGSIPNSIGFLANMISLDLYSNRLSGEIPFSMHNCTQLELMNLGDNDLDGGIPTWMGTHLVELRILILRSNKLSGKISPEICLLNSLQILDLSDNKLSGVIPRCLSNLSGMATGRSLDPYFLQNRVYGHPFRESASIAIKGSDLEYGTILSLVTNINLSKNNLSGNIPEEFTGLVELRSLNLSQNRLTGPIPEKIGDMKQLESLDFSMNSLSGQIPTSMALLSFLNYLNISYNNLTGEIPKSTQLMGLDASNFIGNSLCGPPLPTKCNDEGSGQNEENEEESKIEWVYVVASLGYAVGFSILCSALVLSKSCREAYFGFLQGMWDKLYVYVCIKVNKLSAHEESG